MNYRQTVGYLFTHLPMFQRIGQAAYKKDLGNIIKLCTLLGDPHHTFSSIHIAGTNGKGSVSNMLASILTEAGYNTGLYTSPHLSDFRERIRVNGNMCDEQFVVDCIEKLRPHIEQIKPSFFEISVAMAFQYFAEKNVQIAVIETGLGGRFDSTNIITPTLSVITNISYDHMNLLGNTLAEIAREKAGIIKHNTPCVVGELHPETFPVFLQKAEAEMAQLYLAEENIHLDVVEQTFDKLVVQVTYLERLIYDHLVCSLTGSYQLKNLKTVLQSIEILRQQGIEIADEHVYDGLLHVYKNTGFSGRFQVLSKSPFTLVDCAHNAAGLEQLFTQVMKMKPKDLHIVTGMVKDKDTALHLNYFPREATYYFCKPDIPRGMEALELQTYAKADGMRGNAYTTVAEAMQASKHVAGVDSMILVCGSIFVVAEAMEWFQKQNIQRP
jgi:dihydrofolate synthase/folylpolyglutamate synthase